MTRVEEEKVTTTYEQVDPPKPQTKNVTMVNTTGETVAVNETPAEPQAETKETRTTTTHSEVRQSD